MRSTAASIPKRSFFAIDVIEVEGFINCCLLFVRWQRAVVCF